MEIKAIFHMTLQVDQLNSWTVNKYEHAYFGV
jgi:hypothetical protein